MAHLAMSEALEASAERRAAARAESLGQLHNNLPISASSAQSAAAVAGDELGFLAPDHLYEMFAADTLWMDELAMDGGLDPDERRRLHRERRDAMRERRRWLSPAMEIPGYDRLHPPLPPALPAMPSARERLEYDLAQAHAERQAYERRVHERQRQRDDAIAAAIAAAPRAGRNPSGPPTRVAAALPPAGPQAADRARSLALLARLTGFEEGSQACAFYLDEAGGDVEAAVRAAVQGASLASPSSHPAIVAAVAAGRRDE